MKRPQNMTRAEVVRSLLYAHRSEWIMDRLSKHPDVRRVWLDRQEGVWLSCVFSVRGSARSGRATTARAALLRAARAWRDAEGS